MVLSNTLLEEATHARETGDFGKSLQCLNAFAENYLSITDASISETVVLAVTKFVSEIRALETLYTPTESWLDAFVENLLCMTKSSDSAIPSFRLFYALMRYRGRESEIINTFSDIHETRPDLASEIFPIVCKLLLRAEDYEMCINYLTWDQILQQAIGPLERMRSTSLKRPSLVLRRRNKLVREASLFVAYLTSTNQPFLAAELHRLVRQLEEELTGKTAEKKTDK